MKQDIRYCKTSDDVRIAYATLGSGPPLVWLVGWLSHLELDATFPPYGERCERLSESFTLVKFDKRGTGLSQRGIDDLSLDAHVLDVEAVTVDVGIDKFALFGYSEGGPVAIKYVEKHPDQVSHLVLGGTSASPEKIVGGPEMQNALISIVKQQWGLGSGLMAELIFGEAADPAIRRAFAVYQQQAATAEDALHGIESVLQWNVTSSLPGIAVPTLVLHARDDRTAPIEGGQELAAAIKGARFVSFEGNHAPDQKQAAEMDNAIRGFILGESSPGRDVSADASASPASGLLTILFTDMEGSTTVADQLGDAAAHEVRRTHNEIVRSALSANSGSEIKHTGDGIMASFSTASSALDAAIAIQRGVATHKEADPDSPLAVYVGLNAGEPIAEDDDLFGTSINLAARICDHAEAGQILAANVVRELAAGKQFLFSDLGETELRGFEDPVKLWELRWEDG